MTADTRRSPYARWRSLSLDDVSITGGFWAERQGINQSVGLKHGFKMLEEAGNLHNLRLAAGATSGEYRGPVFMDSDVFKWLEAVGYAEADSTLTRVADQTISLIEAAQTQRRVESTAIPYCAWANRGSGAMLVWLRANHTHV